MDRQALTTDTTSRSLVVATARLNDAINDYVVTFAISNGSTTPALTRFVHFSNATARAIGLPKSDAKVIAALPTKDRAMLSLIRQGIASRIPQWVAQVEAEGGTKPHNRILRLAKEWAEIEVKALRACGIETVISRAEALLAAGGCGRRIMCSTEALRPELIDLLPELRPSTDGMGKGAQAQHDASAFALPAHA